MHGQKSLLSLIGSLWREGRELYGIEAMLLNAEIREAKSALVTSAVISLAAVISALIMLFFAAATATAWLVYAGFEPAIALSIVTVSLLAVTVILGMLAKSRWQSTSIVPHKTIEQVQKDIAAVRGQPSL